jgi:hypothetical protein
MKVKANLRYKDLVLEKTIEKDEIIEVDEERAKVLTTTLYNGAPFCTLVEEEKSIEEEPKVEEEKPKRGRPKKA